MIVNEIGKYKLGKRGEEETKSMPHAPVGFYRTMLRRMGQSNRKSESLVDTTLKQIEVII